ncbi:MAG: glycosyltransferase family 4 protein [Gemmatimonadetes bacterium]|nr:glycosyltransferase family 4 protein [Gemmatimonadota bacterium]
MSRKAPTAAEATQSAPGPLSRPFEDRHQRPGRSASGEPGRGMTVELPRLRIANFSYGLPVAGRKRGGIERAAHTLADGLARRGHAMVVFTHDPKPEGAAYEVRPLPWKPFVETWLGRRVTMGYLGNALALLPDYREFDAIIAHGDSLLLPLAGKPLVRVLHGSALGEARSAGSLGRFLLQCGVYGQELLTALLQNGVVGVSENARRDNPFVGRVIPHGVDDRIFAPGPEARTPEPSVVFVGTLAGRKRGRFLLDVFSRHVRPAHPCASLAVVGEQGPAIPGVTYYTGVADRELAALYRRAWVYASPSTYEGFGLPYLEALACGTPVVATANPGSIEVLGNGEYGRLPDDGDFGPALASLLGDAPARAALAARGRARARAFSLTVMLDRYEELLFELIAIHARSVASA